ncbi:hypothetical protein [Nonomuraea rubra]|uniref:hypothetical protein n=1 Tax=Nonomuraea rubra TaxID=46180 RepID=UPI0033F3CC64
MTELAPWRVALAGPPASFVLDDEAFVIAGEWSALLQHLTVVGWHLPLLYDLLDEPSADYLDDRLDDPDDPLTLRQLARVAEGLVEAATGRRWWVAQRLLASVADEWQELDGALLLRGVDLTRLARAEPARLCNVMYALCVEHLPRKDREMFEFKLQRPPHGLDVREAPVMTEEQQGAAFMSAMHALQGGKG